MANAYSMDFRAAVAAARDGGMETCEAAEAFGCSASWVRRLMQRRREGQTLAPVTRRPPDRRKLKDDERRRAREFLARRPDATLAELIEALDLAVHPGTLSRALAAMDLPRKKRPCTPPSGTVRT